MAKAPKPLPPVEKPLPPELPQDTVSSEAPVEKELTLLEKAKLIADLAAVWENKELSVLLNKLPNGPKVIEVFQDAISREMNAIMSGRQNEKDDRNMDALSKQVTAMATAMGNFHNMILSFMSSPLVQVLDLMNKNLGGRGHQAVAPQAQDPSINPNYSPAARAGLAAAAPQQQNNQEYDGGTQPGRRSRSPGLGSP